MLNRNKKKNDINGGKWIGVGGKFHCQESPEECLLREVYEETGLCLNSFEPRGIITFLYDGECEYMHLFTSDDFSGTVTECSEGDLSWIDKKEILNLPIWEGDRFFLEILLNGNKKEYFSMKLVYEKDVLTTVILNGKTIYQK